MTDLVVYGSLMAKDELQSLDVDLTSAIRVTVRGFRRTFAQEPSWRQGQGRHRAVLTVLRSPQSSFNGVLLLNVSETLLSCLDIRERGYNRSPISRDAVVSFETSQSWICDAPCLYIGKPEYYNPDIAPNPVYRQKCMDAARDWGPEFYRAFHRSTDRLT